MIDLSKQKTFTENSLIKVWLSEDNFMIKKHDNTHFSTLWMHNEFFNNWVYCCRIDTLEELEESYNKRSNHLFEWKSLSKSQVSYSWLAT